MSEAEEDEVLFNEELDAADPSNESPKSPSKSKSNSNSNREQDRLLPISNIARIMKKVVPSTAKLSKGAKESIQDCVSEFIGFVTAEAAEILKSKKRKTVNSEDILSALENTGFGSYKECLVAYTNVLRLENSKKVGAEPNEEEAAKSSGRGRKRKQVQLLTSNEGQNLQGFGDVNTSFDFQPPVFENPQPQQIEQQHHSVLQGFFDINKNLPF